MTDAERSFQRLHERATRGSPLSSVAEAQLMAWYAAHDAAKADRLQRHDPLDDLPLLWAGVDYVPACIAAAAWQIHEIVAQHERLRAEIAAFHQRMRCGDASNTR